MSLEVPALLRRARSAAGLLACFGAALSMACRPREAPSRPGASAAVVAVAPVESEDPSGRQKRPPGGAAPVIWLGLDGLDWELLDRLAAEGKMPHWKRLVEEGWGARLRAYMPILSPPLWGTLATGVGPDVHRILDFQEVDPKTGRKVPVSGHSRAVPAVWNRASAAGKKVGVVGFWATHPAEEVQGFFVSDHASPILFEGLALSGSAFPAALEEGVAQVVGRDGRVSGSELSAFLAMPPGEISAALDSGGGMENKVVGLSRILGSTRVYHRIARDLYDRQHPDLLALYLIGTDEIGHVFAPYVAPRLDCVSEADYARYSGAVDAFYGVVDRMLGQWMRRAEEDGATLIVHSDHGFKWGADRRCERSSQDWNTAAYWHRYDGVFAAWGARVSPAKTRGEMTVFDVAPTIAALLSVPVDHRAPGRVAPAFAGLAPPPRVSEEPAVRRVAAKEMSSEEADEYAKKLRALGYLSGSEPTALTPSGGDRPGMTEGAWNNLGLYLREERKDLAAAEKAFRQALQLRPRYHSPMFNLAILYRTRGDVAEARDWLFRSIEAGHAEPERTIATWYEHYREKKEERAARALMESAVSRFPANEAFARELALSRFRGRDCTGALTELERFAGATREPRTLNAMGLFQTCLGRRPEAVRLFEQSLAIDPNQPGVVQSLKVVRGGV